MNARRVVRIELPEHGFVDLPLAGVGSRGLAALVDATIVVVSSAMILVSLGLALGQQAAVSTPTLIAVALTTPVLLPLVFESLGHGRSPGKAWLKLRVVSIDGHRANATQLALRNVMRLVDFLPIGYSFALAWVVGSSRSQRLGDSVAGTLVIEESPNALPNTVIVADHLLAVPTPLVHALRSLEKHRPNLTHHVFAERRRMLLLRFKELRVDWNALDDETLWRELADD